MVPGTVITGWGRFEWLDGEEFLIFRFHYDHAEFPDAISIFGDTLMASACTTSMLAASTGCSS